MKTRHDPFTCRIFAAWLILAVAWPSPASALRPMGAEGAGLEEEIKQALSAGLEEREATTAEEFSRRRKGRLDVLAEHGENVERLLGRADVRAAVVNLPRYLPLYVQGGALFWAVQDHFNNRQALPGVTFPIIPLPVEHWKALGLILQDPMEERARDNPKGLPVREVRLENVPELTLLDLLAEIFRSRLGIPESEYLGALIFRDAEGQARMVLFSA